MKPVMIRHPITKQMVYTKHPEKLQARCAAKLSESESNDAYVIYTKKQGSCKYGPQFPRKQWRRVAA